MDIASKVRGLIEEPVLKEGYTIDDVLYVKEENNFFLRIIIDKSGIIDLDDCVKVTHIVDPLLDSVDYITDSYILDVCSKEKGCE